MFIRASNSFRRSAAAGCLVLCGGLAGCVNGLSGAVFNPDFLAAVSTAPPARSIPGDAPGILVFVENRTDRWVAMTVSSRDSTDAVDQYTTTLNPGDRSGQLLICPITELTLGSVSDLREVGVRVAAVSGALQVDPSEVPTIEVEAFGVLLREDINYVCGDEITFVVRSSDDFASGFETLAFFRSGGQSESTTP